MKKFKTLFVLTFIALLFLAFNTSVQQGINKSGDDNQSYEIIKKNFWDTYKIYHNNLQKGIISIPPVDPAGIFEIDKHGNFNLKHKGNTNVISTHRKPVSNLVSDYTFSQSTTSYSTIVGGSGTVLIASNCDDDTYGNMPIGFTFNFNGTDYTAFGCSCNGGLELGTNPSPQIYYSPLCDLYDSNVICPFSADLMGGASGNGIYRQTSGNAPNRVFTIEWYHWGFYDNGAQDEMNIQIKLYETSNIIKFIYQPRTPQEYYYDVIEVGLLGGDLVTPDYINRYGTSGWSNTTAGTTNCDGVYYDPNTYPSNGLTFTWTPLPLGIISNSEIPKVFKLYQNYPNPFNPSSTIKFDLSKSSDVKMTIFNAIGQEVAVLVNSNYQAGSYSVTWDGTNFSSGVYFYKITAGTFTDIHKMVLLK